MLVRTRHVVQDPTLLLESLFSFVPPPPFPLIVGTRPRVLVPVRRINCPVLFAERDIVGWLFILEKNRS